MFYRTVACKAAPHFSASTPDKNYYPQFSAKAWLSIADLATKIIDNELAAWDASPCKEHPLRLSRDWQPILVPHERAFGFLYLFMQPLSY
jgi:hypothetical protein